MTTDIHSKAACVSRSAWIAVQGERINAEASDAYFAGYTVSIREKGTGHRLGANCMDSLGSSRNSSDKESRQAAC